MNVWPLPRITFHELSTVQESRPVALITDPTVWATLKNTLEIPVAIQAEPDRRDRDFFESLGQGLPADIGVVYAVGSELIVDAAKMVAFWSKKPLVIIPTAFGSDNPFTWMAWVHENNLNKEVVTGPAEQVIIDWQIIMEAPSNLRGAGIVDVLSIITALLDWRYATQKNKTTPDTRLNTWAMGISAGLAGQALKIAPAVGQGTPEALRTLLDLTCVMVQLDSQLGHRRASHGTEHMFADIVKADPEVSHTERVAAGILYAAALNGQDVTPLRAAITAANVRLDVLKPADIRAAANNLADYAKDNNLPYTILNDQADNSGVANILSKSTLITATKAS